MKIVILCGGRGTRIRDVAFDIPKPIAYLFPIQEVTFALEVLW